FKSAVEPFIQEKMSDENRLQLRSMVESVHSVMLERISASRGVPVEDLRAIADKNLIRIPADAVAHGLVDSLLYSDEFERLLMDRVGAESRKDLSLVKYKRYRQSYTSVQTSGNEIAVIVAEGTIMPGESDNQTQPMVGADTYVA